jgi:hypothetical protein
VAYNAVGYFIGSKTLGIVNITDFLASAHAIWAYTIIEITTRIYTRGTNKVNR